MDPVLSPADPATACPSCDSTVPGRYCGACGERMLEARDHSFGAFLGEAASHVFTLDNRLWRTLRALVRPGLLTAEYVAGRRRPYLSPVQVFLLLTVAFFFIGPDLGLMSTSLAQFERDPVTGGIAAQVVDAGMARTGLDHAAFTARFERVMAGQRRFMILLAVPIFAAVLKLLYRRRSYVVHLAFSTHAVATLLVLVFAWLAALFIVLVTLTPLMRLLTGLPLWPPGRTMAIVIVGTPVLLFLHLALRRVHGEGRLRTLAKAAAATAGLSLSLLAYEHLLFITSALAVFIGG